jgi:hypothetical protein
MTDESFPDPTAPPRRRGLKLALAGAGIAAGAIGATAFAAGAQTTSTAASAGYAQAPASANAPTGAPGGSTGSAPKGARGGATPIRADEKSVSATDAATLKAAALKAVPGGAVYRVETDAGDAAYEVHMTKADGTAVTVKFDKNLAVTKVETGMGAGDPAPPGK